MKQLPIDLSTISVLVDGLDHPEGVAWDPEQGVLYAGGEAGQIYRVDVDARTFTEVANARGFLLIDESNGSATTIADDPGVVTLAAPTNVSFIGPNLDRIAIASLGRWHLGSAELGVSGARLEYPTVQKADTT